MSRATDAEAAEIAELRDRFEISKDTKLGVNDIGWLRVFAAEEFAGPLERDGFACITASRLKEISRREPRLMAKHDYSSSRPWPFRKHGLSVVPLSRDSYLVGKFGLYQAFERGPQPTRRLPVPADIESLDFSQITSESLALAAADLSGILEDFIGSSPLRSTVSGRMSTHQILLRLAGRDFTVDRAQMEIDGGYESADCLVLIEAKNHLPEDFNIRQLYFPYRRFRQVVSKPVLPVYLLYSNGVFHLFLYAFDDENDPRSIRQVRSARYCLGSTQLSADSLLDAIERTRVEPEPAAAPFPQADAFARVVNLCELLAASEEPLTKDYIHTAYGFTSRQADYYGNAAAYLGLVSIDAQGVALTELGEQVMALDDLDARNFAIVERLAARGVFRTAARRALGGEKIGRDEAAEIMRTADLGLGESTLKRRAATVAAWTEWVRDLAQAAQAEPAAGQPGLWEEDLPQAVDGQQDAGHEEEGTGGDVDPGAGRQ
ncbi:MULTISPECIES: type II restriction enzyme [unclassified Corynebacterium]|uniref:type II restriction enzyme n=1 Tax=unclassified Corynebacterium TaxID=2624378 RepID=UPI0034CFAC4F